MLAERKGTDEVYAVKVLKKYVILQGNRHSITELQTMTLNAPSARSESSPSPPATPF